MKSLYILFVLLLSCCFCVNADSWIQKGDFSGGGRDGAVEFVIAEKGYIASGNGYNDTWEYETATDAWTQKAAFPGAGGDYGAGFSIVDKGYLGTGQITNGFTDDFWEYDPATNTWTQKANFAGSKRSGAFAFSIGNKGYLGGGATNYAKEDFWEYDPSTDAWTQKANYGGGKRSFTAGFTVANIAYVGTGVDNSLEFRKDFWEYDPITDIWTPKADFAGNIRAFGVGFSIGDSGYVDLGYAFDTTEKYFHDFWQYDLSTDSWIQKTDYPGSAGDGAVGIAIGNNGYVGTAGTTTGKEWWEYTPGMPTGIEEIKTNGCLWIYPNPIITSSGISFFLQTNCYVTIELFELGGRKIKTLFSENLVAGQHHEPLNREQLPSGIYFLKIKMNSESSIMKILIQ